MSAAYEVAHLTKRYGRAGPLANDDLSFAVTEGECFGVFGPNGAGKTTLVRQLTALLKPSAGAIRLFGRDIARHPDAVPGQVGYYGQRVAALRHHTLWEVLTITGILRGLATAEARRQAAALVDRFALGAVAPRRLATLSGGEQRLALLLATFVGRPRVLVLDEPTNELDPVRRRTLWRYLQEAARERGATVVLSTHNLAEAETVVERVALIDHGRLAALDTPGALKRRVADRVRLEVRLREGATADAEPRLAALPGAERQRPGWWVITAPQAEAAALLPEVVRLVGTAALDDFRLLTPTLEEVYVHFTGRRWGDDKP